MEADRGCRQLLLLLGVGVCCLTSLCNCACRESTKKILQRCTRNHGMQHAIDDGEYKFGWLPFDAIELMCQRRSHVNMLKCFRDDLRRACSDAVDRVIQEAILSYGAYAKAADYMCKRHNIMIFQQNLACLRQFRADAARCWSTRPISKTLKKAVGVIARELNNSSTGGGVRTNKKEMVKFMRQTIDSFICRDRKDVMHCVEQDMPASIGQCPQALTLLVLNYYQNLLPVNCSYEPIRIRRPTLATWSEGQQRQQQRLQQQQVGGGGRLDGGGGLSGGQGAAGGAAASPAAAAATTAVAASLAAAAAQIFPA